MTKEDISEFADNNYELTIDETVKLIFNDGKHLYGFFKRLTEAQTSEKKKDDNKWDFIIYSQDLPPKILVINGDEVVSLEVINIKVLF